MSSATTLNVDSFDEAISTSEKPIIVDFWAVWCGPCKMIAPVLDEIAAENAEKLSVGKVNVDENPDLARRFEVMSIPTLIVFQNGEPVKRLVGAKNKSGLLEDLSDII